MKLVHELAAKVATAPSGKRKKKQLLLKPPPPRTSTPPVNDDNNQARDDAQKPPDGHKFGKLTAADNNHREQSTKNPKASRYKSSARRDSSKLSDGGSNEFENHTRNQSSATAKTMMDLAGVISQGPPTRAERPGSRRTFEELRHCLQFNKVRQPNDHDQAMASGSNSKARDGAKSSTRRKSELTSFLTILFGSMLAVVVLLATSQIACGQQMAPRGATTAAGQLNAGRTDFNGSIGPTTVEIDLSLEGGESSPSNSTPSNGAGDEKADDEHDDGDDDAPASGGKLSDLLASTARDGTDLMLNHLQGARTGENEEQPEERDIDRPAPEDHAQTGQNSTQVAAGSSGNALPLSARNETNAMSAADDQQTKLALATYAKWRNAGDDIIELFSRKLLPIIIEHGYDVDSGTITGMMQVFNGVRQLKPWSLRLLDSWAKLSPGILLGTQSDFGDFDECLNVRVDDPSGLAAADSEHFPSAELDPETGLRSTTVVGRYCLADVEFPKPPRARAPPRRANASTSPTWPHEPIELRRPLMDFAQLPAYRETIFVETGNFFHMLYVDPIRVGICLTNKVDPLSFQQVFNKLLEEFQVTINFRGRCVTKYDKRVWTSYQLVSYYVLLAACSLVGLSTWLDLFHRKLNKLPCPRSWHSARVRLQLASARHRDLFTSFSLIRNTRRLFKAPYCDPAAGPEHRRHQAACPIVVLAQSGGGAPSTGSIADSSVESSPSIERRSSADSTRDLISLQHSTASGRDIERLRPALKSSAACYCDEPQAAPGLKPTAATTIQQQQQQLQVNLRSLHGIRVITMVWMIVNHTYMFGGFFVLWAYRRLIDIAEWPKSLSFQLVLNGWLTVETYFFLSALIIVLSVMPMMRAGSFNYLLYILHRLIRLLPAYVGLVCLNFLWPLISNGPVWLVKGRSFVQEPCERYLWSNFLFINNWFWPEKQCMVHTWFLSADFQLYILAPMIVYLLYKRPALGHWLNLTVAVCASVLSGFVIYANQLLPTTLINKLEFDAIKQQLSFSYFATYQHSGPYCLGLLVGYLLHKRPHARLPKYLTWSLWLLLPPLSITTLLLTYLWNGAYPEANLINPSPLVSALYVAIHRTIWTSLLAWLVFACATGRAKLLASFLSNGVFLPISRLSYSIYLVHLPVIMFRALNLRHTVDWTDQNILWESCGNFVASSLLGFFLYVAFESPIINLERAIFGRSGATSPHSSQPHASVNSSQLAKNLATAGLGNNLHHSDKEPNQLRASLATATTGSSSERSYSSSSSQPADTEAAPPQSSAMHQARNRSTRVKKAASEQQLQADRLRRNARSKLGEKQWSLADLDGQRDGHDVETNQTSCSSSDGPNELNPSAPALARRQRDQEQLEGDQDDLYNVTREYRHYAPGSYQQWRRTLGQQQQLEADERDEHEQIQAAYQLQLPANSRSMRAMQYATLARATRPTRLREQQALNRPGVSTTIDRNYSDDRLGRDEERWNFYGAGGLISGSAQVNDCIERDNDDDNDDLDGYGRNLARNDQLFPNGSDLGFSNIGGNEVDARSALARQRQLLVSRRRQGRYNTLTGSGAHDWRSQLQTRNLYGRDQAYQASQTGELLRTWAQQHRPWAPAELAQGLRGRADGSLFIPRVDWPPTVRRLARSGSIVPAAANSAMPGARQPGQIEGGKIVEEEAPAETAETSAL